MNRFYLFLFFFAAWSSTCFALPARSSSTDYVPSGSDHSSSSSSKSYSRLDDFASSSLASRKGSHSAITKTGGKLRRNRGTQSISVSYLIDGTDQPYGKLYDERTFRKEIQATGITKHSTAEELELKTKSLMGQYVGNPRAAEGLHNYLDEIKVPTTVSSLFKYRRKRVLNRESKVRSKLGVARQRAKGGESRNPISDNQRRSNKGVLSREKEDRRIAREEELRLFEEGRKELGLNFDMDPLTYAKKEVPMRLFYGTNSYAFYNNHVLTAANVGEDWRNAYHHDVQLVSQRRRREEARQTKKGVESSAGLNRGRMRNTKKGQRNWNNDGFDLNRINLTSSLNFAFADGQYSGTKSGQEEEVGVENGAPSSDYSNDEQDLAWFGQRQRSARLFKRPAEGGEPIHYPLFESVDRQQSPEYDEQSSTPSTSSMPNLSHRYPTRRLRGNTSNSIQYNDEQEMIHTDERLTNRTDVAAKRPKSQPGRPTVALKTFRGRRQEQVASIRPSGMPVNDFQIPQHQDEQSD